MKQIFPTDYRDPAEHAQRIEMQYCERCEYQQVCDVYGFPKDVECQWWIEWQEDNGQFGVGA
jgi:hypothetical protein